MAYFLKVVIAKGSPLYQEGYEQGGFDQVIVYRKVSPEESIGTPVAHFYGLRAKEHAHLFMSAALMNDSISKGIKNGWE